MSEDESAAGRKMLTCSPSRNLSRTDGSQSKEEAKSVQSSCENLLSENFIVSVVPSAKRSKQSVFDLAASAVGRWTVTILVASNPEGGAATRNEILIGDHDELHYPLAAAD